MAQNTIQNSESLKTLITLWNKWSENKVARFTFGALIGAIVGLLYWRFIGCSSGSCPLTSDPYRTVGIFAIMGGFMAKDRNNKSAKTNNENN